RKQMIAALAEMDKVPRGELVVGANEGTCLHILPEVFAEFKKQYPGVAVSIRRSERAKVLESIIDNSVDFGVISIPVSDNRLTVVTIHRDELVLIAAARHPLARMKSASIADAVKFPLLLPKLGRTRDALEELFHARGMKPNISMELDSSELLKRFVAADVGVGFIARSNVVEDVKAGVLAAVPIKDAQIRRDLALVFRKDKALSGAAQCTRACVKEGSAYGLVVDKKVYKLEGKTDDLVSYAGEKATVTGTVSGDTIKVASVAAAK